MGFLLVEKLNHSLKFPSKLENRKASSFSFDDFQTKISNYINQILLKPEPGLEFTSLAWFLKCFDFIHVSNDAFAKMVAEINYPMTKWGTKATEEYLNYSLNLMDFLNSINHSISHLNHSKITISHALNLVQNSAIRKLKKVPTSNPHKDFKPKRIEDISSSVTSGKENIVLKGLMVLEKTSFLALGFVLSGLCGDDKVYMKIRELVNVSAEDSLTSIFDSRLCKEVQGIAAEVKDVNCKVERLNESILTEEFEEDIEKLKRSLKVMEELVDGIEKDANSLFSQFLGTRNKLLGNIRLTENLE